MKNYNINWFKICVIISLTLFGEVLLYDYYVRTQLERLAGAESSHQPPITYNVKNSLSLNTEFLNEVKTKNILARPLFSEQRRPPQVSDIEKSSASTLPRLTAIIINSSERSAIFVSTNDHKSQVVKEGDMVEKWQVDSIIKNQVHIMNGQEIKVLHLSQDPYKILSIAQSDPSSAPPTQNSLNSDLIEMALVPAVSQAQTLKIALPPIILENRAAKDSSSLSSDEPFNTKYMSIEYPKY